MLGKWMNAFCACRRSADTVDRAQESEMDLICRKLKPESGRRLLDIGGGWGGLTA